VGVPRMVLMPWRARTADGAVEQAEVEAALLGLHQVPGEFAHAHDVDAGILHQARIPVQ